MSFYKAVAKKVAIATATASCCISLYANAIVPNFKAPELKAKSYVIMDSESGKILDSKNASERYEPASLTKMMTAYIVEAELAEGRISLDDMVPVSVKAWKQEGSRMFIREGTSVKLSDLLRGVVIQSGNDASVALAEYIAGSEEAFADLMNQHALKLGMQNTHFINSTGLPDQDHFSSAEDLAILARAIVRDFPDNFHIYAEKEFEYNNIKQANRNKLLFTDSSVDCCKTGYTSSAKYGLVASAKRDDFRIITVVMGVPTLKERVSESQSLISYAYRAYESMDLYKKGAVVSNIEVRGGKLDSVPVAINEDVSIVIKRGEEDSLEAALAIGEYLEAPVEAGTPVGKVFVKRGTETLYIAEAVTTADVEEAGFFEKIWKSIVRFFKGLFD